MSITCVFVAGFVWSLRRVGVCCWPPHWRISLLSWVPWNLWDHANGRLSPPWSPVFLGWWVQAAVHHRGCAGTAVCNTDVLPRGKHEYVLHSRLLVMGWRDQTVSFCCVVTKPCLSCAETKTKVPVPLKALLKLSTNFTIIILGKITIGKKPISVFRDEIYSFVFSSC